MNINMDVIREVMAVAKRLDEKTLVNTFEGNISAKVDGKIYITPTTKNKGLLTEDMIAVMDENGNQIHGNCKPTSELPMHTETYTIRDDIGGVVHCHPPYLTAYALANKDVETRAYPEMMGNFCKFECAPYGRPGTDKILAGAIPILQNKRDIVLLGNHGLVACGRDLKSAYGLACNLEYVAELQYRTMCIGTPNILTDEQMAEVMERFRSYGQPGSGKAGY